MSGNGRATRSSRFRSDARWAHHDDQLGHLLARARGGAGALGRRVRHPGARARRSRKRVRARREGARRRTGARRAARPGRAIGAARSRGARLSRDAALAQRRRLSGYGRLRLRLPAPCEAVDRRLLRSARARRGARLRTCTRVERVLVEGGRAAGVRRDAPRRARPADRTAAGARRAGCRGRRRAPNAGAARGERTRAARFRDRASPAAASRLARRRALRRAGALVGRRAAEPASARLRGRGHRAAGDLGAAQLLARRSRARAQNTRTAWRRSAGWRSFGALISDNQRRSHPPLRRAIAALVPDERGRRAAHAARALIALAHLLRGGSARGLPGRAPGPGAALDRGGRGARTPRVCAPPTSS